MSDAYGTLAAHPVVRARGPRRLAVVGVASGTGTATDRVHGQRCLPGCSPRIAISQSVIGSLRRSAEAFNQIITPLGG